MATRKSHIRISRLATALLAATALSCSGTEGGTHPEFQDPPWVSGIPFLIPYPGGAESIPHDDRILETPDFLTFSDASSDDVKVLFTTMADEAFSELREAFGVGSSQELGIRPGDRSTKITIYSDRHMEHANLAFQTGFLLIAMDSPIVLQWFGGDQIRLQSWYQRQVKHETMHVMQWLLGLDWEPTWSWERRVGRTWPEFWFQEGIAEYVSGGVFDPIETWEQVQAWTEDPHHVNPIGVRLSTDAPVPDDRIGEYYPMFGLAVRYLLDDRGLGKSLLDVKELYLDMRTTVSFRESFEGVMGLSIEEYEARFFELVSTILP